MFPWREAVGPNILPVKNKKGAENSAPFPYSLEQPPYRIGCIPFTGGRTCISTDWEAPAPDPRLVPEEAAKKRDGSIPLATRAERTASIRV